MLILCPRCATSYHVEPSSLGVGGRSVRCVRCRTVWFATPRQLTSGAEDQRLDSLAKELAMAADSIAPGASAEVPSAAMASTHVELPAGTPPPEASSETMVIQQPTTVDDVTMISAPPAESALPNTESAIPLTEAPSLVPPSHELAALPVTLPDPGQGGDDFESFSARRERLHEQRKRKTGKWRLQMPSMPLVIVMLAILIGALIGWRKTIVHYAPQTASLYERIGLPVNLRGLVFDNIKTMRETQDGIPVLVVEGTIGSKSQAAVEVPRLRFSVRNAKGAEVYSWTAVPSRSVLGPGEQLSFRSRLASPPEDAQGVAVRFFTRHDAATAMR